MCSALPSTLPGTKSPKASRVAGACFKACPPSPKKSRTALSPIAPRTGSPLHCSGNGPRGGVAGKVCQYPGRSAVWNPNSTPFPPTRMIASDPSIPAAARKESETPAIQRFNANAWAPVINGSTSSLNSESSESSNSVAQRALPAIVRLCPSSPCSKDIPSRGQRSMGPTASTRSESHWAYGPCNHFWCSTNPSSKAPTRRQPVMPSLMTAYVVACVAASSTTCRAMVGDMTPAKGTTQSWS